MFCNNCGKENNDNAKFCKYCGAKLIEDIEENVDTTTNDKHVDESKSKKKSKGKEQISNPVVEQEQTPKKKPNITIFAIAAVLVLGIVAFAVFYRKPIDLSKAITINIDTTILNGYATADIDVDYDAIAEQISRKRLVDTFLDYYGEDTLMTEQDLETSTSGDILLMLLDYEEINKNNISNGDDVGVKFSAGFLSSLQLEETKEDEKLSFDDLCKALKIKMKQQYTIKAEGLKEGTPLVLMPKNIEDYVYFKGVEAKAEIKLRWPNDGVTIDDKYILKMTNFGFSVIVDNQDVGGFSIDADKLDGIKQGDDIKLVFEPSEQLINYLVSNELSLTENEHIMHVEKLPYYVQDLTKLSKEDLSKIILGALNGNNLSAAYFGKIPTSVTSQYDTSNGIILCINGGYSTRPVLLYNITVDPNNNYDWELKQGGYSYESPEVAASQAFSDYELTPIPLKDIDSSIYYKSLVGQMIRIVSDDTRIRKGPSTSSEHLVIDGEKYYPQGSVYEIMEVSIDSSGYAWYKVEVKYDVFTWVRSDLVELEHFN